MSGTISNQGAVELLERYRTADASERAQLLRDNPATPEQVHAIVEAAAAQTWVDAREALAISEWAWELAKQAGSAQDRATARRARARALAHAGRLDDAVEACREGIADAHRNGLMVEAGRLGMALMRALGELGRFDEAVEVGRAANRIFETQNEPNLAARVEINLGILAQRKGDPKRALQCFDRALEHFRDEPELRGTIESNRGEALLALNDFPSAKLAFQSARQAFETGGARLLLAIAEGNLADLAVRQGKLQEAMFHFERSRAAFESDQARAHLARLLAEQAEALGELGLPQDAVKNFEIALAQLEEQGLALEAARARMGLGASLLRIGRDIDAERELSLAAASFAELGNATARAKVDLIRGEMAFKDQRHAEAHELVLRALAVLRDRPADCVAGRLLLGRMAAHERRSELAEAEYAAALAVARELDLAPFQAEVLLARALLRRQTGSLSWRFPI